jgi:CTP:molybdopterin cytidylyltransferase MocA
MSGLAKQCGVSAVVVLAAGMSPPHGFPSNFAAYWRREQSWTDTENVRASNVSEIVLVLSIMAEIVAVRRQEKWSNE